MKTGCPLTATVEAHADAYHLKDGSLFFDPSLLANSAECQAGVSN